VDIDPATGQLATPACPVMRKEVFLAGTEPEFCELHGGRMLTQTPPASWLSRIFGGGDKTKSDDPAPPSVAAGPFSSPPVPAPAAADEDEKKSGLLHKIFGIFGGKKPDQDAPKESNPDSQH
jgi:hypothetical protein